MNFYRHNREPEMQSSPQGTWPHSLSSMLATLGCTLGLFNISRFAILSIHFGGKCSAAEQGLGYAYRCDLLNMEPDASRDTLSCLCCSHLHCSVSVAHAGDWDPTVHPSHLPRPVPCRWCHGHVAHISHLPGEFYGCRTWYVNLMMCLDVTEM